MKLVILVLIVFLILNNLGKKEEFRSFNRISNYYYINLDRHQDRRKYMENQFQNHKLSINRFKAFDKNLINQAYLDDLEGKNVILQFKPCGPANIFAPYIEINGNSVKSNNNKNNNNKKN